MTFIFKEKEYTLPDGLTQISVTRQQAWSLAYGHALTLRGMTLDTMFGLQGDTPVYQAKRALLFMDEITQALSFYAGIPLADVRQYIDMADIVQLLKDSEIAHAIQNIYLPLPQFAVATPDQVEVGGQIYFLTSPRTSVELGDLTHNEFLIILQLTEYLLQLSEGNWTNFHLICAGFVRRAGEIISMDLIDPLGERAKIMRSMDMADGIGLAQYFNGQTVQVLQILDQYTSQQLLEIT